MRTLFLYFGTWVSLVLMLTTNIEAQKFVNLDDAFGIGYVEVVFQDSYGLMWVASRNGLYRFDGYTIKHFTNDPEDPGTLPDNNVVSVGEDARRNIWVCLGSKGIATLDRNHGTFELVCPEGEGFDCSGDIAYLLTLQDTSGKLWVGTTRGLLLMNTDGLVTEYYTYAAEDSSSLYKDYVLDLYLDDKNRLWAGTSAGINLLDRSAGTFTGPLNNPGFPSNQILDIKQSPGGEVFICPRFGPDCLLKYDEDSRAFSAIKAFGDRTMGEFKIAFDRDTNLWISSRGVGAFMQPHGESDIRSYLPANAETHGYRNVYGLEAMTDKYGNVWFAGPQLHYMPSSGKNIRNISSKGNITISVFADDDAIWYCAERPYRWDRETMESTRFMEGIIPTNLRGSPGHKAPRIYKYLDIGSGKLLIITSRNIIIWNKADDTYIEYPGDYGGPFRDVVVDSARHCLWICGNQGRPIQFDWRTGQFSRRDDMHSILNPQAVELDADGILWFGTLRDGVVRFDPESGEKAAFNPESPASRRLNSARINDIEVDHDGTVWIGTTRGLNRWTPGADSVVVYRKNYPGLESDFISSILIDNRGKIWLGTGDGLSEMDPTRETFRHFGQEDGLICSYFIPRACFKDANGVLYFGGNQGIDMFAPSEMGSNDVAPDLYVSNIRVNDRDFDSDSSTFNLREIVLQHFQNFVEVELLALHLTAPHANKYAYRIQELRNEWIDLGNRRIVALANSSPGTFTIEAIASNADGVWSEPRELITIVIKPPFYRTWWFIALCALGAGLILWSGYRYRIAQVRKKEQLKTEFEKQIAQLEMKALRAQMNPHFLFNSLNSIKSLISAGETENATEYVTRFSQLIRQVLSNSERPLVRLQEDLNALRLYMEIERLRFQNFTYSIEVADNVNADFIEVSPLLLQPYVENAIWHGLLHKTDGERKLDVRVHTRDDILVMEVQDNGIGRERARSIKMRGGSRKGGLGMKITGDRIRILKDYYGQEATVEMIDLKSEDGTAAGTLVRVCIPVVD